MVAALDSIDRKILMELQADASQSLDDIAKKVGASKTPVWNRIKKLRETGVIKQQTVILEAHRLAGEIDYILKVRVANARAYDEFYQALISEVKIFNVTALLSMQEIKSTQRLSV